MTPVRLEPAALQSRDKHSTTEPLRSLHVRNKKNNTQGRSHYVVKVIPYLEELLLKERICCLWEQNLSFKRSCHFVKGRNFKESLLDTVVSLLCA